MLEFEGRVHYSEVSTQRKGEFVDRRAEEWYSETGNRNIGIPNL